MRIQIQIFWTDYQTLITTLKIYQVYLVYKSLFIPQCIKITFTKQKKKTRHNRTAKVSLKCILKWSLSTPSEFSNFTVNHWYHAAVFVRWTIAYYVPGYRHVRFATIQSFHWHARHTCGSNDNYCVGIDITSFIQLVYRLVLLTYLHETIPDNQPTYK